MDCSLIKVNPERSPSRVVHLYGAALFRVVMYSLGGVLFLSASNVWADEATDWLNRAAIATLEPPCPVP